MISKLFTPAYTLVKKYRTLTFNTPLRKGRPHTLLNIH
jgi:hypothetical protein